MESRPLVSSPALNSVFGPSGTNRPNIDPPPAPVRPKLTEAGTDDSRMHGGPVVLDPSHIQPSPYGNRHERAWKSPAFKELKRHIGTTKGNVQPIKVRPINGSSEGRYEIVYGHRRHRACLELGLPVMAIIENVDDRSLVVQMVHENLARKDSSPYERAEHMRRTLDLKVFTSAEKLADATGLDRSSVYKLLKLASLPEEVVTAFHSPAHIQVNFGARLEAALDRDRDGVLERAREIATEGTPTDPKLVIEKLAPQSLRPGQAPQVERVRIELDGKLWALLTVPAPASGDKTTVVFEQGAIDISALRKALLKLSSQRPSPSRMSDELKPSA